MVSSEIPRRSRSRRSRGPNVSRSDMAMSLLSQFLRRTDLAILSGIGPDRAPAANVFVIGVTMIDPPVPGCLSFHGASGWGRPGGCCSAGGPTPFDRHELD